MRELQGVPLQTEPGGCTGRPRHHSLGFLQRLQDSLALAGCRIIRRPGCRRHGGGPASELRHGDELQNLLERSVILTNGSTLNVAMPELMEAAGQSSRHSRNSTGSQASERERIIKALEEAKGQVGGPNGGAARLGLKRTTLQNRMQKYKIARQYR